MKIKNSSILKVGKLPAEILKNMLEMISVDDPDLVVGPGIGLDCSVIDIGDQYMVVKSDPITFVTKEIGWYAIQIITNDIYTTGAKPKWLLPTIFLPENISTKSSVFEIAEQLKSACDKKGIVIVGGHTEITAGLNRPIISCTAIGFIKKDDLLSPRNICAGDQIILTKGIPIEGVAILANEFEHKLRNFLNEEQIEEAKNYIHNPGISVETEKDIAINSGTVHAMHDPTEGGLSGALWELADACNMRFLIDPEAVQISPLSKKICDIFMIQPWCTIASGALLIIATAESATTIVSALADRGVNSSIIGTVEIGRADVNCSLNGQIQPLPRPERDEIAKLFESKKFE